LELIKLPQTLIGINTQIPNKIVKQAIENDLIKELSGYENVKAEVKTSSHTRLDLLLEKENKKNCYVEIKNCTLVENGVAMFPDAVTTRGQKHLDELESLVAAGSRGVIFFLVQRMDAKVFKPAKMIDKVYADKLKKVVGNGVEIVVRDTLIDTKMIEIRNPLPVKL
jgi:sugar fermentation stimulation protein A